MTVLRSGPSLLVLLLALLLGTPTRAGEDAGSFVPSPLMLGRAAAVDAARERVVLARPGGGLEAVATQTGETLWTSAAAERPLLATADVVLAQARGDTRSLALVLLAPPDGAGDPDAAPTERKRLSIPLGEGEESLVDDRLDARFDVGAELVGTDVRVSYALQRLATLRGAPVGMALSEAVLVDPATGTWARVEAKRAKATLPAALQADLNARGLAVPPTRVANGWALPLPAGQGLRIHRWDAEGQAGPTQVVAAEGFSYRTVSADRQHVLLASLVPGDGRWRVVALATGATVAEVPAPAPSAAFLVAGERLLLQLPARRTRRVPDGEGAAAQWVEEPLEVVALDAADGAVVWRRAIRDLRWRGGSPPARRPPGGAMPGQPGVPPIR